MCYNIIKEGENKTFQNNLESAPDREVRKEENYGYIFRHQLFTVGKRRR